MIRLDILTGKQAGQSILVRRFPFWVGRDPASDLVLNEAGVWDRHCSLEYQVPIGYLLLPEPGIETRIDQFVADRKVRLHSAAEISIGGVRMRFNLADPTPRGLGFRELIVWGFLLLVVAAESWLIYWLPR
ncbi:hypothetical protein GC207_11220 [bacterium]|nr:hypothetical protein [bacterium]